MSSPIEDFFRNPVLRVFVEPSDRIKELESTVEQLTVERDRLLALYSQECDTSMAMADLLRSHGIRWR